MSTERQEEVDAGFVRPYTLTGGRTETPDVLVPIEAVVSCRRRPHEHGPDLGPVERAVWDATRLNLSSAEISARLGLPLVVVRVLVGDLVAAGHAWLGPTAQHDDEDLIRRLIAGVSRL
ncbi:MAG: DUF742 domain-containing protein [Actinomycetota bacterium]